MRRSLADSFKCIEQVRADITITIPDPIIQIPIKLPSFQAIIPIPAELSNLTRISPKVNELLTNVSISHKVHV